MTAPLVYCRECGPISLAAVTGLSPERAAELLWGVRGLWLTGHQAATTPGAHGTPEHALGDALVRLGYGVDLYEEDGALGGDLVVYPRWLRRVVEERATMVRRVRPSLPVEVGSAPHRMPLSEWLARHRGGGWWLYIIVSAAGECHALAAWGSKILTGEDPGVVGAWMVVLAFRVHPPLHKELRSWRR